MLWLLLVCVSLARRAEPAVIIFYESSSFSGITNCSCQSSISSCFVAKLVSTLCTCVNTPWETVEQAAKEAKQKNLTLWTDNDNATLVCCQSLGSDTATRLLSNVLDFAAFRSLTLEDCHNASNNTTLTVYVRRRIVLQREDSSLAFRGRGKQKIHLHNPDWENVTDAYRHQSVVFLSPDALSTSHTNLLKSWSYVASLDDPNMPKLIRKALARAPERFGSRRDRTFMATPIYV